MLHSSTNIKKKKNNKSNVINIRPMSRFDF